MDEKYTNSFIDSSIDYLFNLQYLADNDKKTMHDLSVLSIIKQVYDWAEWFEVSEFDKIILQKKMDKIILGNSKLTLTKIETGNYYSNVSSPQTIFTWQRVYDNFNVKIHNNWIDSEYNYLLDENDNYILSEDNVLVKLELDI